MGIYTWMLEHHPEARMNRVVYDMTTSRWGYSGFESFGHESKGFITDVSTIGQAFYSGGRSLTGNTQTDAVIGQGLFYDPGKVDLTSYGVLGYYRLHQLQSRSQDEKADDGDSIELITSAVARIPNTLAITRTTMFVPAGLLRVRAEGTGTFKMMIDVVGEVLCKDIA